MINYDEAVDAMLESGRIVDFDSSIEPDEDTGCHEWLGRKDRKGYGVFSVKGRSCRAHRLSFAMQSGDMDEGLCADHLCQNPACVNPEHLEAVTPRVNTQRGGNAQKTHCKRGHRLSADNVYRRSNNPTQRRCKACTRASEAERRRRMYAGKLCHKCGADMPDFGSLCIHCKSKRRKAYVVEGE